MLRDDGHRKRLTRRLPWAVFAIAILGARCGGDSNGGGGNDGGTMPPEVAPTVVFDAKDPCMARVPQPTDLFRDEDGVDQSATCAAGGDPIETAIKSALADEGVPLDSRIIVPMTGEIDIASLTSTVPFSLTGSSSTAGSKLPPTILLETTGTGTRGYALLGHGRELDGMALRIVPVAPFEAAKRYVVVVTDEITAKMRPINQHPAIGALVGEVPVNEGAFEGLDAETAARLERTRRGLEPVLDVLERANPPVPRSRVRSIQVFSTAQGFARLEKIIEDYRAALTAGRFAYQLETTGGEIPPADVYPEGTPVSYYINVRGFLKGHIRVPKVVGENGRMIPDWTTAGQTIRVPFLVALPMGGAGYRMVLFLPGFRRSKQDVRDIASAIAGAPRAAIMGIDLRCHGDRALDATGQCLDDRTPEQIAMLVDQNTNGNPERAGPDGVADNSGAGFFPGDPIALRDTQIAAMIETIHILETFQRGQSALMAVGLTPSNSDIHVIAHGHSAPVAVMASVFIRTIIRTVTLASGGTSIRQLVEGGHGELKNAFDATLPAGVTAQNRAMYLTRLESSVLEAISFDRIGDLAHERYLRQNPTSGRILLAHGNLAELVPQAARQALIDSMDLDSFDRVSRHNGDCDSFYLFTCRLGDNIAWGERAREQIASYIGSGGVTVLEPAR